MNLNSVKLNTTRDVTLKGNGYLVLYVVKLGKFFVVLVDKRDSATLIPIITSKVFEGSTIISDCWKSYDCLSQHDFEHLKVNHKYNFVDPETLAHTQNIENLWRQIKRQLPETYTKHEQLYLHLSEYMWLKSKHHKCDLYLEFLRDAAKYVRT